MSICSAFSACGSKEDNEFCGRSKQPPYTFKYSGCGGKTPSPGECAERAGKGTGANWNVIKCDQDFDTGNDCVLSHSHYCQLLQSTDRNECCLSTAVQDRCKQCMPGDCPLSAQCNDVAEGFCTSTSQGRMWIDSDVCQKWCSPASPQRGTVASWCDQAMKRYCAQTENQDKSLCSCFNSIIPNPSCFDPRCTNPNAYKTQELLDQAKHCPDFCGNIYDCLAKGTCTVDSSKFTAICGSGPTPSGTPWYMRYLIVGAVLLATAFALFIMLR